MLISSNGWLWKADPKEMGEKYTGAITKETKETQASGCQLETLIALKQLVLNEFLELIESSIQNSNPSRRLLTISGQYAPVYERFVPVYRAGIFLFYFLSISQPFRGISTIAQLLNPVKTPKLLNQHSNKLWLL